MKHLYIKLFVLSVFLFSYCDRYEENINIKTYKNPIKIGYLSTYSVERMAAENQYLAAYLAVEEINSHGGINGRDLQIVSFDDGGSDIKGVQSATKMNNSGIKIILGADWSDVSIAVAEKVTIPNNMLQISYSSTSPALSTLQDKNLFWRTAPSDVFQGKIGAEYCFYALGKRKVSILSSDNLWASGLSNVFYNSFINLGGTVTKFVYYPDLPVDEIDAFDYTPYLDSVFSGKPDLVYFAVFPTEGAKIANDILRNNYITNSYKPLFFSNDGIRSDYFILNSNKTITDLIMGTAPGTSTSDPNFKKFSEKFYNCYNFDPVMYGAEIYDAVYCLAYAMLKGGGTDNPVEIAKHLKQISDGNENPNATLINVNEFDKGKDVISKGFDINYDGASGKIDFDMNGDPGSGTYVIWRIKNGTFVPDTVISFPKFKL